MRRGIAALLLACAPIAATAQTASTTIDGDARQFSALTAIKTACPAANAQLIDSATDAIVQRAWQSYGRQAFDAALTAEIPRRRAEVDATGQEDWCRYQRGYLRDLGLRDAFLR